MAGGLFRVLDALAAAYDLATAEEKKTTRLKTRTTRVKSKRTTPGEAAYRRLLKGMTFDEMDVLTDPAARERLRLLCAMHLERLLESSPDGLAALRKRVPKLTGQLQESAYVRREGPLIRFGFNDPKALFVKFKKPIRGARGLRQALRGYERSSNYKRVIAEAVESGRNDFIQQYGLT